MTKITVKREALDRWHEALKSLDPHIQQLAVNALRATASQPEQEPVALKPCRSPYCECDVGKCSHPGCYDARHEKLNPPAAQREWQGLTDEEIQAIHDTYYRRMGPQEFARAIEAKLKEKNT